MTSEVVLSRAGEPSPGAAFARPCYRIPALAVLPADRPDAPGRIVAAWDVRADWRDLPGPFDLVLRHSDDGGRTWSPVRVLRQHEGERGFGDASLLVGLDGTLFCWYVSSDGESFFSARPGGPGLGLWLSRSDDGGLNWTHRELPGLRPAWAGGMFAASGNGSCLTDGPFRGRLYQPFVARDGGGAHWAVPGWSDDGEHWMLGERVGPDCDENKLVGLPDGSILMHARATPRRRQALLAAGADRFTDPVPHEALVEPGCNGGLCRWGGLLVASLPDDATRRRRLALRWSADQGRTWSAPVLADAGAAGYSVVQPLADGALGLIYEAGDYEAIIFVRIEPGELGELGGAVSLVARPGSSGAAKPPEVAVPGR